MDEKDFPPEEEMPVGEVAVEESDDELVDSDAMSDAEGGFSKGAEGDINYFGDDEDESNLDDDERIEN